MRCEMCYKKVRVRYNISLSYERVRVRHIIGLYTVRIGNSEFPKEISRKVCTTCKKDIIREMKRLIGDRLL